MFVVTVYKMCFCLSSRILFGTLRAILCILIVMFGFVPVLFRYAYPLQRIVIFLNFGKCDRHMASQLKVWEILFTLLLLPLLRSKYPPSPL